MELTFNKVNLAAEAARGQSPADMIRRATNETWYVPFSPLRFDQQADWRFYKRNDHVVIPLLPYLVPSSPTDAFGFLFQLGVNAMHQLGGQRIKRLHLSLGEPVNQVYDETSGQAVWSFQLGLGVVLEQ